jgi:hypothetical protein
MTKTPAVLPSRGPRHARHLVALLAVLLLTPVLLSACGGPAMTAEMTYAPPAPTTALADDGMTAAMNVADRAAWDTRPAFVSTAGENTQVAYAFAVTHADVLSWMPCYCGCAAMGHGSNLDCFVQRHDASGVAFEEHASYCDVCVDIALKAKTMLGQGHSLLEIRQAIDATFGGTGAPGTETALPPA